MTVRPSPSPRVRLAARADEAALVALCRVMHAECAIATFSEDRVKMHLARALDHDGGICGVLESDGIVIGASCLILSQLFYTDDWHWGDLFLYVRPAYRSKQNFRDLERWSKWWADDVMNMPLLVGVMQTERTDAKVRLFRSEFRQIGGLFAYGDFTCGRLGPVEASSSGRYEFTLSAKDVAHG